MSSNEQQQQLLTALARRWLPCSVQSSEEPVATSPTAKGAASSERGASARTVRAACIAAPGSEQGCSSQ